MLRLALVGDEATCLSYAKARPRIAQATFTRFVGDESAADAATHQLGVELSVASVAELLERHASAFDALRVPTDSAERGDWVERAAAAAKHVFLADPLSADVAEAERLTATCHDQGVCLMIGNSSRCLPATREIHNSLRTGKLGALGLLRIHRWSNDGDATTALAATVGEVDLACWMFSNSPDTIYATRSAPGSAAGANWQLHLGFPQGGMALIDYCGSLPDGTPPYYMLTAVGSQGAAYADDHHNTQLLFQADGLQGLSSEPDVESVQQPVQEFIDAVSAGRPPECSGDDWRRALLILEAAAASLESGRATSIPGGGNVDG